MLLRPISTTAPSRGFVSNRILAFAAAGAIELTLVAALMSGLAIRIVKELPHELTMVVLTPVKPPETIPPVKPDLIKPEAPTVPAPAIVIRRNAPPPAITVAATPTPVVAAPQPVTEPVPIAPTPLQSIMGTHTSPPYPELARRLSQQGQVQLHIAIATDGSVSAVSVTKSSGSDLLDDAAKNWVLANWRYHPATENGVAVAAETDAIVAFDLKTARG